MAKFRPSSILGEITNSVGNETYCVNRGIPVVKRKISVNHSRTPKQVLQQEIWEQLARVAASFEEASLIGYPSRPRKYTYRNAFVHQNKDVVEKETEGTFKVNYPAIKCSEGNLTLPEASVTLDAEAARLTFTHEATEFSRRAQATDQLYALVVEEEREESKLFRLNTREDDAPVSVALPARWNLDKLHVYVFVLSENGRKASRTLYFQPER